MSMGPKGAGRSGDGDPREERVSWRFFWGVTAYPKTVLTISAIIIGVAASFVPTVTRDTRAEAFINDNHPSVVYRNKVKEIFGLYDPMIVAIVNEGPHGIFNPKTLELVSWLTEEIANIEGVDPDRITSIATEKDIYGTDSGMIVEKFFEYAPETQKEADTIRENVMDFPLYLGSLVARDGSATVIVAELLDLESGGLVYSAFLDLVERAPVNDGEELHVAGEGAVNEFMGFYIDRDAKRLNPISGIVITLILVVAYRTLRGIILPNIVVLGAVLFAIGSMAASGVPFYVITNALPVILIAISVADAIHILGQYYEELANDPKGSQRNLVVRSMVAMWRPVTFTSLTDMAGFLALSVASTMPPMQYFGVFASIGVLAALAISLFTLPAALVLLKPKQSSTFRNFAASPSGYGGDVFSRVMASVGAWVMRHPTGMVIASAVIIVAGIYGAQGLEINEQRMNVFRDTEPIVKADNAVNTFLDGTSYLDIVVETREVEDLFKPELLAKIEALQRHVETLPHVRGSTSIVDYLKQMNRAMNEDKKEAYTLPESVNLIAQYFLLYSVSGDPNDFEEQIDYDYRLANVRAMMDTGKFTDLRPVVLDMERYLEEEFDTEEIRGHLAGRVSVDYSWIKDLGPSHFRGVALALVAVWLMASLSFRSFTAGLLTATPVSIALLSIYAVMGFANIWLGIGTSMFAAIAIGVSVDFAIHTVDRLIVLVREEGRSLDEAFEAFYPSTGRALLFSFTAMVLGFGVLLTSEVPTLNRFGLLVDVAVGISFVASMTLLPALIRLTQPAFLGLKKTQGGSLDETDIQLDAAK